MNDFILTPTKPLSKLAQKLNLGQLVVCERVGSYKRLYILVSEKGHNIWLGSNAKEAKVQLQFMAKAIAIAKEKLVSNEHNLS